MYSSITNFIGLGRILGVAQIYIVLLFYVSVVVVTFQIFLYSTRWTPSNSTMRVTRVGWHQQHQQPYYILSCMVDICLFVLDYIVFVSDVFVYIVYINK